MTTVGDRSSLLSFTARAITPLSTSESLSKSPDLVMTFSTSSISLVEGSFMVICLFSRASWRESSDFMSFISVTTWLVV